MATVGSVTAARDARVLIASSNEAFRKLWLVNPDYNEMEVVEAAGGADALARLDAEQWQEVLLDRRLHDLDVREVVHIIRTRHPHVTVRVVDSDPLAATFPNSETASSKLSVATVSTPAVDAGDRAARMVGAEETQQEEAEPRPSRARGEALPGMMGSGPGLEETYRLARLVGARHTAVLITGETGTGKELVARGIHQISPRSKSPFVVVNCAAIPEPLLEAELFGHARGAFTGAVQSRLGRIHVAHGGTLFLDEVGELPLSIQAKLLRFLQDGEVQRLGSSDVFRVDVRVISATNVNLLRCVQEKQFRQDLYYRLAVFPLELPALRHRKEDIVPLAEHFLEMLCAQAEMPLKSLSASAAAVLKQYLWPGNVRELQHAVERAFILTEDERQIRASHFNLSEPVAP